MALAEDILGAIEEGRFAVGGRLPSERALAESYSVACLTVRQSLELLVRKGVIVREHGRGTFVRAASQRALIGVLCMPSLSDEPHHFCRGLVKAAHSELRKQGCSSHTYDGFGKFETSEEQQNSEAYRRFQSDLHHYSFKGLIQIYDARHWTCPKAAGDLPTARLHGSYLQPDVSVDYRHFAAESLAVLNRAGRQEVVYFRTLPTLPTTSADLDGISCAVRALGIRPPRVEQFDALFEGCAVEREAFERTLALVGEWRRARRRPGALLVSDDIAARGVALALSQSGVRVPVDLTVVSLTNEGIEHHYGIPILRYEIPLRNIAFHLVRIVQARIEDPRVRIDPVAVAGQVTNEQGEAVTKREEQHALISA